MVDLNELKRKAYECSKKRAEKRRNKTAEHESVYIQETDNLAAELCDIICCVLIIAENEKIDIEQALLKCIEKNRKRAEGTGDKK